MNGSSVLAFLGGAVLHYVLFEVSHWLMHVEDNGLDRLWNRMPLLSALWARQIRHHKEHHDALDVNFSFTPPYIGDELFGTRRKR